MNEIRHIHLGRQAFTIAADAYTELQSYLEAIKHEVGREVAEEVELRMAELLADRGITGKKVVLAKDVAHLKEQLGEPGDFSENSDDRATEAAHDGTAKRLFRDTDHGMVAGVAAGLAQYFSIDAIIIRLLFIGLVFFGGSGILLYIILWLLVPEAKTKSERLQMSGLAVNVSNIKDAVDRADVPGAARRLTRMVTRVVSVAARIVAGIVGVGFVLAGIAMILGSAILTVYGLVRGLHVGSTTIFPVGAEQVAVLVCALVVVAMIAAQVVIIGLTLVRRKWPIPGWILAAMIGIFIVAGSIGAGLAADVAPHVRDTYKSLQHSVTYQEQQPITQIQIKGSNVFYHLVYGDTPAVEIRTFGTIDTKSIAITRDAIGNLVIDSTPFQPGTKCQLFCPYGDNGTEIYIHLPKEVPVGGTSGTMMTFEWGNYIVTQPYGRFMKAIPDNGQDSQPLRPTIDN